MRVLGVDTAGSTASVALIDKGELICESSYLSNGLNGTHSELLLPFIQAVLKSSSCRIEDLAGLAVSIGPGSFTGLRIGLATVKGLAYATGLPVSGVPTLLATAAAARTPKGALWCVLDALKRDVYVAGFQGDGRSLARMAEDSILSLDECVEVVRAARGGAGEIVLVGDGAVRYRDHLCEALQPAKVLTKKALSVAAAVAMIGAERLGRGESEEIGALTPVYLRPPGAQERSPKNRVSC